MDRKKDEFPEVLQKTLSDSDVIKLLSDIKSHALLHEVRIKQSGKALSDACQFQELDTLTSLVLNHQIHSIQISYTFENELWLDTVLFREEQWSLVRMPVENTKRVE